MPCTVFLGSRKPHLKECVLVFDHDTGDFTLERLTNNIVVKKTRAEGILLFLIDFLIFKI